jgi:O-antigen ligase
VPPLVALAAVGGDLSLGPVAVDGWLRGRFRGWAANPNQLALALLLVPFALSAIARRQRRSAARGWLWVLATAGVTLGGLTRSDALGAAWAAGSAGVMVLVWLRLAREAPPGSWGRRLARGVVPALLLLAAVVYGPAAARMVRAHVQAELAFEGSGAQRSTLLRHGLEAWSRSPIVGLGPGAHSGYPGPFDGMEAHNTLVDWGMSTGAVGAAALVVLLAVLAARVLRARDPLPAAGLAALLVFAAFHYMIRHPVFWLALVTVVALADGEERRSDGVME